MNRFEAVISTLANSAESVAASRSRILDADFAAETAKLTRAQILQQAGVSILSQANAIPQSALAIYYNNLVLLHILSSA
ncbi:MAG: flagellin [Gammaproteobacteria bacterium]|nr:flagellin [Gammaproteobacteria bacterium]